MQPIALYSHQFGPNPWKVALILEELKIPYTTQFVDFTKVTQEPYTLVSPNGRLPAIEDPNTDIKLWESGAITEYLIEKYDTNHQISYSSFPEQFHTNVLESVLKNRDWLVGDKCTYADLCFIAWQRWAPRFGGEDIYDKFPHVGAWMKRMEKRPTVQKVLADQDRAMKEAQN